MNYLSDREARELICSIGRTMSQKGYVAANDGNLSIRVGDDTAIITPTGINKGELTPEMLLKIDFDGNVIDNPSNLRKTSETRMHMNCYKSNNELMSTCHTHAQNAMVWACAGIALDVAFAPEPQGTIGKVPVAPYGYPGGVELSESVIPFTKDYKCCLLANHGAMSWGYGPKDAWYVMEALEAYAKLCIQMRLLQLQPRLLSLDQIEDIMKYCGPVGMSQANRMFGGNEIVNTQPAINLSEVLGLKK